MVEKKKLLSILILTWNGEKVLRKNLESIFNKEFDKKNWEVVVVDNGSTDGTLDILADYPQIRVIKLDKNIGFSAGNNVGIKTLNSKYSLLLNQDVEQVDKAITEMVDFLEKDKKRKYGAVAPKLLYPDGRDQDSCRPFYTWDNIIQDYLTFGYYRKSKYNHSVDQDVDQPMASVLMVRTDLLQEIGGFSEHRDMWLYFSDVELSYQIHKRGYQHRYLADSKFYHHHGEATRKLFPWKRLVEYHRGFYRYFYENQISSKFSPKYWLFLIILGFSFGMTLLREMLRFGVQKAKLIIRK